MSRKLLDPDNILSINEEWEKLDKEWGTPIDLETEDTENFVRMDYSTSTMNLNKPTFTSPLALCRPSSSKVQDSDDYQTFLQNLNTMQDKENKNAPSKEFYFIGGDIMSSVSVEEICESIDDIFKSIEKLCSATSTVRDRKIFKESNRRIIPAIVESSISASGLSFDESHQSENFKNKTVSVESVGHYIDKLFEVLTATVASRQTKDSNDRTATCQGSVTMLVEQLGSYVNRVASKCDTRRLQCSKRFQELAEFWRNQSGSK